MEEPSTTEPELVPARRLEVMSTGAPFETSRAFFTPTGSTDGFWLLPAGAILSHQRYMPNPTTARMRIVTTNFPRPVIICALQCVPLFTQQFSAVPAGLGWPEAWQAPPRFGPCPFSS